MPRAVEPHGGRLDDVILAGGELGELPYSPVTTTITSSDTGSGTEATSALTATFTAIDTGTGTDAAGTPGPTSADTGAGAEATGALAASFTTTDTGSGADAGTAGVPASSSDTGTGTDSTGTVTASISASDTGTGTESTGTFTASVTTSDGAAAADVATAEGDGAGVVSSTTTTGSWWTLINLQREQAEWVAYERSRIPPACPLDGEPLLEGPGGVRFCKFDGWTYPRDHVRVG